MEEQLAALIDDVVDEVNEQLVETKLSRTTAQGERAWRFGGRVLRLHFFRSGTLLGGTRSASFFRTLNARHVRHGGYLEIQENGEDREGWNVVLIRPPDSSYGEWLIVESRVSAHVGRTRFEPVATEAELLAENLIHHWTPAMHTWVLKDERLERRHILVILDRLIPHG